MANPFTYSELHSKDAKKARVHAWDVRPDQKKDSVLARHEKVRGQIKVTRRTTAVGVSGKVLSRSLERP
jgi:hypothetical protein